MKGGLIISVMLGLAFHAFLLMFGGAFMYSDEIKKAKAAEVEEYVETEVAEKPTEPEEPEDKPKEDEVEQPEEQPQFSAPAPDSNPGPALAALDMASLAGALDGMGGDAAFGGAGGGLGSGGVIGGRGGPGGGGDGEMFSAGQLDQKPRLLQRVDPKLPAAAAKSIQQVSVVVYMDANGSVIRSEVTPTVDPVALKAIQDAVQKWKYEPGQRGGKKVPSKVSHKLSFAKA